MRTCQSSPRTVHLLATELQGGLRGGAARTELSPQPQAAVEEPELNPPSQRDISA